MTPSRKFVSAGIPETYAVLLKFAGRLFAKIPVFCGIGLFSTLFNQLARAELTRPLDLRIEIDKSLNTSRLCQNLVRLHEDRNFAPWGLIFSKPSHFCPFPLELSKSYGLFMWRLLVTEWPEHVSFIMCRPTRPSDILNEDCSWRIDLKKKPDLVARLQDDQVLFTIVSALHEKLPVRGFDASGENYARPEPRLKSPLLENPPRLMRSVIRVEEPSGRLLITPLSFFKEPASSSGVWFVHADPMKLRHAAMAEIFARDGLEIIETPPDKPVNKPITLKNKIAPQKQTARIGTADSLKPETPLAAPAPRKPVPLKAVELPPVMPPARPPLRAETKGTHSSQPSVFASESLLLPPDDREVIQLEGAAAEEERSRKMQEVPLLTRMWNVLWLGLWKGQFETAGLPVQESERSRLPATQSIAVKAWHPVWRIFSIGFDANHIQEKEHLDLKITLPGTSVYQQARGQRRTTFLTASLLAELSSASRHFRGESRWGLVYLNENWSYDRSRSTFEIWMPSKRGTYFEPSLSTQPKSNLSGLTGRAAWGSYTFDNASGTQWSAEAGWQWAFDEGWFTWDSMRIPSLQSFIGLQQGTIRNTGASNSAGNVNSLAVNAFTLGLRLNIDETD